MTSPDNKVMGDLRKMNLEKRWFLLLLWVRLQGCKAAGLRRTSRCNSTNTTGLLIVQLFTTSGLGSPTRQCLRENKQHKRGSSYPVPLWQIRSSSTEILWYSSLFNWRSSQSGKYSAGDSLSGFDFLISHLRLTSVKVGNQALRVAWTHTQTCIYT